MTQEELKTRVDALMAKATKLQDEGKWTEADDCISEAENLEDQYADTQKSVVEPDQWDFIP